jgi:hypothetical protein
MSDSMLYHNIQTNILFNNEYAKDKVTFDVGYPKRDLTQPVNKSPALGLCKESSIGRFFSIV